MCCYTHYWCLKGWTKKHFKPHPQYRVLGALFRIPRACPSFITVVSPGRASTFRPACRSSQLQFFTKVDCQLQPKSTLKEKNIYKKYLRKENRIKLTWHVGKMQFSIPVRLELIKERNPETTGKWHRIKRLTNAIAIKILQKRYF